MVAALAVTTPPSAFADAAAQGADTADITDAFTGDVGSSPAGWSVSAEGGTATVQQLSELERSLRLQDDSTTASMAVTRSLGATRSTLVTALRLRAAQTTSVIGVHLRGTAGAAATVAMDAAGRLYTYDGAKRVELGTYQAGQWLDLRIVAHPTTRSYSVFLKGRRVAADLSFRVGAGPLTELRIGVSRETAGTAWIDDVRVFASPAPDGWRPVGTVTPRTAQQIGSSRLLSGCETTGRKYARFSEYRDQLLALGTTTCRVQPEWNAVEANADGRYNWTMVDEIVDTLLEAGVQPWLQVSYGNWAYGKKGIPAGGANLGAPLPSGAGLEVNANWVKAMVERYKPGGVRYQNRGPHYGVRHWEIWNEPNHPDAPPTIAADYAAYYKLMATTIRQQQPDAVLFGVEYGIDVAFADRFMAALKAAKDNGEADGDTAEQAARIGLVNGFSYHPYSNYPDNPVLYNTMAALRQVLAKYSPAIEIRQGENGAPSTAGSVGAFGQDTFTEYSQNSYNLRRIIGDLGVGISTELLGTVDLWYRWTPSSAPQINSKGLVAATSDLKATYTKRSYYGVQNVAALFDDTLRPVTRLEASGDIKTKSPIQGFDFTTSGNGDRTVTARAFEKNGSGQQAVALWFGGDPAQQPRYDSTGKEIDVAARPDRVPNEDRATRPVTVTFADAKMSNPRLVDLTTGTVHRIPPNAVSRHGNSLTITGLPIGNTPVVVADRSITGS
ncbi:hypothetical protein BBK82_31150 [Lentzea guizhouensis]|uniref:Glycosyl hydrolases family 39 N-terminal catalytic domain-containing protein n=1 Tax=Lentzea guizhouensis TaxID=1586287 RepID=A0A1B2HQ53_9PSEU|nr:hypothetical protein BBK82_31150 [Lentzea guizhouensis]